MTSEKVVVNNSFPVFSLLGATLVVLKGLGYITWPWVWVLAPFWVPLALVGVILAMGLLLVLIAAIIENT
jgi:hypothetical protein